MKNLRKTSAAINTINFSLAKIILAYLPFHAILAIFFKYKLQIPFFPYLKELVIITILLTAVIKNGIKKDKNLLFITLYSAFAIASYLWSEQLGLSQIIIGAKYDLSFLWVFLAFHLSNFNKQQKQQLKKTFFHSGTASIIFSLLIHLIGHDKLVHLGFRNDWSTSIAGESLAFCQRIEHQETCRLQGLFSGPNQLGNFILIHLTLTLFQLKNKLSKPLFSILLLDLIALYLTYSRSSLLGLILIIFFTTLYLFKKHRFKILATSTILFITAAILIYLTPSLSEKFLRLDSNSGHISAWLLGIEQFFKAPFFGQGIASAGPASSFFTPIIPENWLLQVAIQYGIFGYLIFKIALLQIANSPFNKIILLGFIPPLLLLHPFESSAVSYSLFALLALHYTAQPATKS